MRAASQLAEGRRERVQWCTAPGTSVSKSILATTFRLCTYGSLAFFVGFFLSVGITFRLAVCCLVFFLLDGWATSWLNSLGDDDAVRKVTRTMCIAGQVTMLTTTVVCMPLYHISLVRAGCLLVGPSILAIGFSHDVWETSAVLLVHFAVIAAGEAEPAFLLCLAIKDCWLVFGAWKGERLFEATRREASLRHHYNRLSERMMQQALNLLLDCTLVVEQASEAAGPAGGSAPEGVGAPGGCAAWRVCEEDQAADHFFGVAMQTVDMFELVPSRADRRRVQEALRKATQGEEKVSTMLSNVSVRCSALTGAAAKTVQGSSAARGSDDDLLIEADVDLIIVGRGGLLGPSDHLQRATALVGVRAAERARDRCVDDVESDESEASSRPPIEEPWTVQNETADAASAHSSSSASSADARDMGRQQHVASVSVVVDVFSERLDVKKMVLHLSQDDGAADKSSTIIPGLADWLHADELEYTREWVIEGAKAAASDKLANLPGHGPIRFYCGQKAFVDAAEVEVERLDIRRKHWRGQAGDDSSEEEDDEEDQEEDGEKRAGAEQREDHHNGLSRDGKSQGSVDSLKICLRLRGITAMVWPPWADSPSYRHYVKHALRRHGDQAGLRRRSSLRPIAEHRRRGAVETGELCSLK